MPVVRGSLRCTTRLGLIRATVIRLGRDYTCGLLVSLLGANPCVCLVAGQIGAASIGKDKHSRAEISFLDAAKDQDIGRIRKRCRSGAERNHHLLPARAGEHEAQPRERQRVKSWPLSSRFADIGSVVARPKGASHAHRSARLLEETLQTEAGLI